MCGKQHWLRLGLWAGLAIVAIAPGANAGVLTFEGEASGFYINPLTTYGGFSWTNFNALNNSPTLDGFHGGYVEGAVSGTTVAYNPDPSIGADVTSATPFTFNSAYFTGAFNDGLNVTVEGWASGSLLYTTSFTVNAITPSFQTFDYVGIDDVRVFSSGGTFSPDVTYGGFGEHVAIDDFAFTRNASTAPVPEPSGLLLAAAGAVCLGSVRAVRAWGRRRDAQQAS